MSKVRIVLDSPIYDGISLTFKAPCDCSAVDGIIVYYRDLTEETSEQRTATFTFKDAHGNTLTGIGNLFSEGAYVKVILDTNNGYAYIQNADTNGYLEGKFVDYVVEEGESESGWRYRKWNSGIAECWKKISMQFNNADPTKWTGYDGEDSGFYSLGDIPQSNLNLPFTFADVPIVDISLVSAPVSVFVTKSTKEPPTTSKTGDIKIYRPLSFPQETFNVPFVFAYDVKGRWK